MVGHFAWGEPLRLRSNDGENPTMKGAATPVSTRQEEAVYYHLTRTSQARPRRVRLPSHEARLYHILPATRPSQQPPLVPRLAALGIGGA